MKVEFDRRVASGILETSVQMLKMRKICSQRDPSENRSGYITVWRTEVKPKYRGKRKLQDQEFGRNLVVNIRIDPYRQGVFGESGDPFEASPVFALNSNKHRGCGCAFAT
jgi:hypothetical protein